VDPTKWENIFQSQKAYRKENMRNKSPYINAPKNKRKIKEF
jgi:hypothetical protein